MIASYKQQFHRVKVPYLTTTSSDWETSGCEENLKPVSEPLEIFEGDYLDNEYHIVPDPKSQDTFYMYNPETIIKVNLVNDGEKAESLYI